MAELVRLDGLREGRYGKIICYPKYTSDELDKRLEEMRSLRITAIEFAGESKIFDLPIQGKGCVSIVVQAYTDSCKVALKIRRTDADRSGMTHEATMLQLANSVNVGPKLLDLTRNFLVMEFVDGLLPRRWIQNLDQNRAADRIRSVLRDLMEQCWRLDELGLDHGELSRASKHAMINAEDRPYILDFETASLNRRVSNVTSICQYLFLRSELAETVRKNLSKVKDEDLIDSLRIYKRDRSRQRFEEILELCKL